MKYKHLPFRQIHMDFHTSEKIAEVGQGFDPEVFADTLAKAHVNSVTCFARCHHGMFYYDSKRYPELVHPGLARKDLLERQIAACHARGIRVPTYTTIQWDHALSQQHPDWVCLNENGQMVDFCSEKPNNVYEAGFYRTLCVNNPAYRRFLFDHTAEICESMPVDGFFFDIVNVVDCSCVHCQAGMREANLQPARKSDRLVYARQMLDQFKQELSDLVWSKVPDATVFYNSSHMEPSLRDSKDSYSHWELESLPSGDWGYFHFPNAARLGRTLGLEMLGQTGKFHTVWGDFHSFKNPEALAYECSRMLAYNARCLIGDQLDPDGVISPAVYDLVGPVYAEVEKKEPWCVDAVSVNDMAIYTPEALGFKSGCGGMAPPSVLGASMMLEELGCQFDIIDGRGDLTAYKLLILPDRLTLDAQRAADLSRYLAQGGKIIASYQSGLKSDLSDFALADLGLAKVGDAPYSPDFVMPAGPIGAGLPATEHVMYKQGLEVSALPGTEVLIETWIPYFNRTWEHFCSHRHTPSAHKPGYPAVTRRDSVIYFMHPVFETYQTLHPRWCRTMLKNAIHELLPDLLVQHDGPATTVICLNEQPAEKRYILHALHVIPYKNCDLIYTIDDLVPLHDLTCSVLTPDPVATVRLVPENIELPFTLANGRITFTIPKIVGHAMVELAKG